MELYDDDPYREEVGAYDDRSKGIALQAHIDSARRGMALTLPGFTPWVQLLEATFRKPTNVACRCLPANTVGAAIRYVIQYGSGGTWCYAPVNATPNSVPPGPVLMPGTWIVGGERIRVYALNVLGVAGVAQAFWWECNAAPNVP